ncbi:hypothetical protein ACMFMG_008886 [Clarireedia jacksonii]
MKTSFVLALATFVSAAFALPAANAWGGGGDGGSPSTVFKCTSLLYSQAQCCDVDVLGVADLNCQNPITTPTSVEDFTDICASVGKIDRCCTLPVLGQALVCNNPE